MSDEAVYRDAARALNKRDGAGLIKAAGVLLGSSDESSRGAGFLMRGGVYEYGTEDVAQDLVKAVGDYRMASVLVPTMISYWYLGRALLKSGEFLQAEKFLKLALAEEGCLPDIAIDLGRLYERGPLKSPRLALQSFGRAALKGRFQGFLGMARVLSTDGRGVSAFAIILCAFLLSPLLWIGLGKKAFANY